MPCGFCEVFKKTYFEEHLRVGDLLFAVKRFVEDHLSLRNHYSVHEVKILMFNTVI